MLVSTHTAAELVFQQTQAVATCTPVYEWKTKVSKRKHARAVVVLVHGLTEHAQCLTPLASQLLNQNYLVFGVDLRGHGKWHQQDPQSDGYRCDFDRSSIDLELAINALHRKYPVLPCYLVGESIGAAVSLRAAADLPDKVNGISLCSFGGDMTKFNVRWALSDGIKSLIHRGREIPLLRYQQRYACENPDVLRNLLKDPEIRTSLTARESLKAHSFLMKNMHYGKELDPKIAVLLIKGSEDKIVSQDSADKFLKCVRSEHKSLKLVLDSGHMLIGRPDIRPETVTAITSFINTDIKSHSTQSTAEAESGITQFDM